MGHKKRVRCLAWNATGEILASGALDGALRVWSNVDRKHAKATSELKGHAGAVNAMCGNKEGPERLATTSTDKTIRLWDVRTNKSTATISLPGEGINIAWSPDGSTIACGVKGTEGMSVNECQKVKSTLIHVDTRKNTISKKLVFFYVVNKMSWNVSGTHFFLITGNGEIEIRTWPEFSLLRTTRAHTDSICTIDMNPNGRNFAVGCADSLASLWDTAEMACLRTFGAHSSMVHTLSISHDGQFLASGCQEDPLIDISHVETGETLFSVSCDAPVNEIAWNPKQLLLAYDHYNPKEPDSSGVRVFGYS
uniref:Anaphase-promoting complex subunit 4 WD40 domain-containing protein n=1 Tax=Arcella intermedia TaxID=1963864 RepID=A0A6B2L9X9_9EUKA